MLGLKNFFKLILWISMLCQLDLIKKRFENTRSEKYYLVIRGRRLHAAFFCEYCLRVRCLIFYPLEINTIPFEITLTCRAARSADLGSQIFTTLYSAC